MARVFAIVLGCLGAHVALAACEPAHDSLSGPRVQAAHLAVQRAPAPASTNAGLAPLQGTQPLATAAQPTPGEPHPLFRPMLHDASALKERLRTVPELSRYASRFMPFDARASDQALKRGERSRGSIDAWTFADGPFSWSPQARAEYLVTAGRVGERALIAVLEVAASGELKHAASLIIDEKDTTVALGTSAEHPTELLWTTCYGCPGEGGSILLGDDGRPRFAYR